jgi:hypothetical protein
VTLEGNGPHGSGGVLDRLRVEPGSEVTLEVRGAGRRITVQLEAKQTMAAVSFRGSFQMTTKAAAIQGTDTTGRAESLTYRAMLSDDRPALELSGQPSAMTLVLTISPDETQKVFPREPIPVTALEFTWQGESGSRVSSLVSVGAIGYPSFPSIPKGEFKPPDLIGLDQLEGFQIEEIGLDPVNEGLRLRLSGIAGHVATGAREHAKDHRLTVFDMLLKKPVAIAVLGFVVWMLPTGLAGYRLWSKRL